MKPIPYREVRRKLLKAGFYEVAQAGSHVKFAKTVANGLITTTVPKHREVASGTLRSILRQAHLTESEFEKLQAWHRSPSHLRSVERDTVYNRVAAV